MLMYIYLLCCIVIRIMVYVCEFSFSPPLVALFSLCFIYVCGYFLCIVIVVSIVVVLAAAAVLVVIVVFFTFCSRIVCIV